MARLAPGRGRWSRYGGLQRPASLYMSKNHTKLYLIEYMGYIRTQRGADPGFELSTRVCGWQFTKGKI